MTCHLIRNFFWYNYIHVTRKWLLLAAAACGCRLVNPHYLQKVLIGLMNRYPSG